MIREKSCGAIVYASINHEIHYLIVQMQQGHYGFPKGHVEAGETEVQTAIREIREETGLTAAIDTGFRKAVEYSPYEGCIKEVVYFLASTESTEAVRQEAEIKCIQWLTLDKALALLSHENDRQNLLAASEYLSRQ